jgi:cytochrome c-type biogenesis protein CcsB
MGFDSHVLGFNEPTMTKVAYICYMLAFLMYAGYLMTMNARALRVRTASGGVALAGAGAGGTVEVGAQAEERPRLSYSPVLGRIASGFVVLAWLSLTSALAMRWVSAGHPPWVTLYEVLTTLTWGTTTIYLVLFEGVLKTRAAGAFSVLLIFSLQSYAVWVIPADLKESIPLVPALRSYWLLIHVSMAIIAYSAFATAAGAGLTFMAKHHLRGRISKALPSEAAIEEFMFRAVAVGFPFQTLLLITGAIWAQEAWTKAWSWDPKETWALVTWLMYAAYLHVRVQRGVRGITMAWLSLIGFSVVLFTLAGVNYLVKWFGLESMHTYNVDNSNGNPGLDVTGILMIGVSVALMVLAVVSWLRVRTPAVKTQGED